MGGTHVEDDQAILKSMTGIGQKKVFSHSLVFTREIRDRAIQGEELRSDNLLNI
jgi:hypothetical protein